jgi:MoxR-like ATPase
MTVPGTRTAEAGGIAEAAKSTEAVKPVDAAKPAAPAKPADQSVRTAEPAGKADRAVPAGEGGGDGGGGGGAAVGGEALRPHAEDAYAAELAALAAADDRHRPARWRLSPWAVATYLLGGTLPDGTVITPKYVGPRRIVEVAVSTLATDRALLLLGVPGTAKTWVSEHLAAAVSGDSTLLVQGTAGTPEEAIRYGWDYARLLAHGPSREALVPSPVMRAMAAGKTARVEELTRIPADVQDTLITILSEKTLPIPELGQEVQAVRGFNLIATANDRDRGVNDLSSALRRRFNTVVLPLPATAEDEVDIVTRRVGQLGRSLDLPPVPAGAGEIRRVVTVFRELRAGATADGRTKLKSPSGTLSTAEAISVVTSGLALAAHFGDGVLRAGDVAAGILGAVVRDPAADRVVWQEYLEAVVRERDGWQDFYRACREVTA